MSFREGNTDSSQLTAPLQVLEDDFASSMALSSDVWKDFLERS